MDFNCCLATGVTEEKRLLSGGGRKEEERNGGEAGVKETLLD